MDDERCQHIVVAVDNIMECVLKFYIHIHHALFSTGKTRILMFCKCWYHHIYGPSDMFMDKGSAIGGKRIDLIMC